jgi:hypothetical protein
MVAACPAVMAGLVPAIHVLRAAASKEEKKWMPATRPGMTSQLSETNVSSRFFRTAGSSGSPENPARRRGPQFEELAGSALAAEATRRPLQFTPALDDIPDARVLPGLLRPQ